MKLNINLLIGTVFAFSSCVCISAQENANLNYPVPLPPVTIQAYSHFGGGNVQYLFSGTSGGSWSYGNPNGNLNHLNDPSVMKDLELVEEQISKIGEIRSDYNKQRQEMWTELAKVRKAKDKQRMKAVQESVADLPTKQNEAMSDVLLPHQLDRIKQVSRQIQMQNMGGASSAFQHGQLAKELEITDEQKKKLAEIQKQMNEDIVAKSNEIRAAAKKRALDQLTAQQKSKFQELTGEEFKRNPKDWQQHRQRTLTRRQKN